MDNSHLPAQLGDLAQGRALPPRFRLLKNNTDLEGRGEGVYGTRWVGLLAQATGSLQSLFSSGRNDSNENRWHGLHLWEHAGSAVRPQR